MPDIVSPEVRSRMMSGIRGKNTKPEMLLRRGLHSLGFRFRLHDRKLPGCPDLVFPKYNAVIFVHGCFWHGHNCHLFKMPSSRSEFWQAKIGRNQELDLCAIGELERRNIRHATVWECALKGRTRMPLDEVINGCATWLTSTKRSLEIEGS